MAGFSQKPQLKAIFMVRPEADHVVSDYESQLKPDWEGWLYGGGYFIRYRRSGIYWPSFGSSACREWRTRKDTRHRL
jgi:hypothetical protein